MDGGAYAFSDDFSPPQGPWVFHLICQKSNIKERCLMKCWLPLIFPAKVPRRAFFVPSNWTYSEKVLTNSRLNRMAFLSLSNTKCIIKEKRKDEKR
ncbi:hypothetical protein CEXT_405111 [Caerostris extrusa]|uniref:Uncharacterized protein n=1 Tax=Caerostris extrusa TaxID=172846 RepID=A0AAV4MI01_CAEEX|nr:hypothetical protein CEXT_405111 [Caerostris extrusa]